MNKDFYQIPADPRFGFAKCAAKLRWCGSKVSRFSWGVPRRRRDEDHPKRTCPRATFIIGGARKPLPWRDEMTPELSAARAKFTQAARHVDTDGAIRITAEGLVQLTDAIAELSSEIEALHELLHEVEARRR